MLKEDLYVFEGQQLEILFDLLEEQLSSFVTHKKECLSVALEVYTRMNFKLCLFHNYAYMRACYRKLKQANQHI